MSDGISKKISELIVILLFGTVTAIVGFWWLWLFIAVVLFFVARILSKVN